MGNPEEGREGVPSVVVVDPELVGGLVVRAIRRSVGRSFPHLAHSGRGPRLVKGPSMRLPQDMAIAVPLTWRGGC